VKTIKPLHLMKRFFFSLASMAVCMFCLLVIHMMLVKPADANWQSWPTAYMVQLFQQTTAADTRDYLGISTGTPTSSADASEVQMDDDYIYFATADNQWVRIAVEAVYNMAELETGDSFLLETGDAMIFEEN